MTNDPDAQAHEHLHRPAVAIDRVIRQQRPPRSALGHRAFFHDILIAATARKTGATIMTCSTADFALLAQHVAIDVVEPWPDGVAT